MKYGSCTKCMLDWIPKKYWNGKHKIWYSGCKNCGSVSFWSGGTNASQNA